MEEIVLAKQAETAGNAEKAAELYEKAFGKTGEDWLAVKAGELYRDAGNLQKGRKIIDRVIGCGNSIIYDRLIRFYFDSGKSNAPAICFYCYFPMRDGESELLSQINYCRPGITERPKNGIKTVLKKLPIILILT